TVSRAARTGRTTPQREIGDHRRCRPPVRRMVGIAPGANSIGARNVSMNGDGTPTLPTKEELQSELAPVPEPLEPPEPPNEPAYEEIVTLALRHAKGRRGVALVRVLCVCWGARRAVTTHSDVDLVVLVKGQADAHEIVRVADRLADIRYWGHKDVEEELCYPARLPALLRKPRILRDHDAIGAKLIERASHRFRQGPSPANMNEQIRLKAACFHWLGQGQDVAGNAEAAPPLVLRFFQDF